MLVGSVLFILNIHCTPELTDKVWKRRRREKKTLSFILECLVNSLTNRQTLQLRELQLQMNNFILSLKCLNCYSSIYFDGSVRVQSSNAL